MVYGSENVLCPYYKDETKNSVRCEGIFTTALSNNFESSKAKREYRDKYCCDRYTECGLFKTNEQKYYD